MQRLLELRLAIPTASLVRGSVTFSDISLDEAGGEAIGQISPAAQDQTQRMGEEDADAAASSPAADAGVGQVPR
jgi:hypothetical protein